MKNLQSVYQAKIGKIKLGLNNVIAGSKVNFRLSYTAGEIGIDDSGSIKVLFRIVTDAGTPQFKNKDSDNFVTFSSSNNDLKIIPISKATGFPAKLHIRPWCKGMQLILSNSYLSEGESINIDFHNWRVQTFCEKKFEIKVLIDPFACDKFIEVPDIAPIEIVPDKPEKLIIVSPTTASKDKPFRLLFKLEDRWGNPCLNINRTITIVKNSGFPELKNKIFLKKGRAIIRTKIISNCSFISAQFNNKKYWSNPVVTQNVKTKHFWADLHGQTEETVGTGTIEEYLRFAKELSLLDVVCHQGNDFQVSDKFWRKINFLAEKETKDGRFIFIPGYEWSGNSSNGGDRNVLYLKTNEPIFRSSRILLNSFKDTNQDALNVTQLFKNLKKKKALTIAHVGGRFATLDKTDSSIERLIEIHSVWGTFEWILFDALKRGMKVGIVANSDGHDGRVGSSYSGSSEFNSYGGLTSILTDKLTRKNVFNALYKRHCYATTGARIFINQELIVDKKPYLMGDELFAKSSVAKLNLNIVGTSNIDLIEVMNGKNVVKTWIPRLEKKTGIKILWSGSKTRGRQRKINWKGEIGGVSEAAVFRKINFFNLSHKIKFQNGNLLFKGVTTGGVQGLILKEKSIGNKLTLTVSDTELEADLNNVDQIPRTIFATRLDAKVQLSRVNLNRNQFELINFNYKLKLRKHNAIFIKVTQNDGHMAWTSPIYIDKE